MVRRQSDIIEDLRSGSSVRVRESLLELLLRGGRAPVQLRQLAADRTLRTRVLTALEELGTRALMTYAAAPAANRQAARELFCEAEPATVLQSLFDLVAADDRQPSPQLLAPLIELGRALLDRHRDSPEATTWGAAAVGLAELRLGRREDGLASLKSAIAASPGQPAGHRGLTLAARAAGELALDSASHADLLAALLVLWDTHARTEAADLLAGALLTMQPDQDLVAVVSLTLGAVTEQAGSVLDAHSLLKEAWDRAQKSRLTRAAARQGYFSGQLRRLDRAATQVRALLEQMGAEYSWRQGEARELCNQVAERLGQLLGDFLAYQPLRVQPTSPRRLVLEVATACKDDLAALGVSISCAPAPAGGDDLAVPLDPALTIALLRQVLRQVAVTISGHEPELAQPPDSPAIVLYSGVLGVAGDEGAEAAGATFGLQLSVSASPAANLLEQATTVGTVPDILSRTGGTYAVSEAGGGVLEFSFRSARLQDPSCNPGLRLPARGDLIAALNEEDAQSSDQLAQLAVAHFTALRQSELESWGQDLALILHDLKNSIAFVTGWLRDSDVYDQATVRARCLDNLDDVQFWLSQIDAMFTRAETNERPWVDLAELLQRVLQGLAALLMQRRIRLALTVPDELPKVQAEPVWLASALRNLVKNAVEATPDQAQLEVSAEHIERLGLVEITVRDQGPGFPDEILLTPEGHSTWGNGLRRPHLGLASVRRVLAEQGGELQLRNDNGGVAVIRLRLGDEQPAVAAQVPAWERLAPDAKRALVAARALAETDRDAANHLWSKALQIELEQRLRNISWPALMPWATDLVSGSSQRPALSQPVREALNRAAVPGAEYRTEAAARRLLAKILAGEAHLAELSVLESGLLLLLFGVITSPDRGRPPLTRFAGSGALHGLAQALLAAAAAIDDETTPAAAVERAVIQPLAGLAELESATAGR